MEGSRGIEIGLGHVARVLRCCWEPRSDPSRYEHAVRFSYESTLPTNFGHNRMGLDEDDTLDAQGGPKRIFLARYAVALTQKLGVSLPAPEYLSAKQPIKFQTHIRPQHTSHFVHTSTEVNPSTQTPSTKHTLPSCRHPKKQSPRPPQRRPPRLTNPPQTHSQLLTPRWLAMRLLARGLLLRA